jgi:hypothetical protein
LPDHQLDEGILAQDVPFIEQQAGFHVGHYDNTCRVLSRHTTPNQGKSGTEKFPAGPDEPAGRSAHTIPHALLLDRGGGRWAGAVDLDDHRENEKLEHDNHESIHDLSA